MRLALIAMLTTLFFSVTPLTAYSADPAMTPPSSGCVMVESIVTPDAVAEIEKAGGSVVILSGIREEAFLARLVALVGSAPPFTVSQIYLITPDGDDNTYVNVAIIGDDNCIKGMLHLPQQIVEKLLSPLETKPGERVD